jgi:predicted Rossmann-fold nucleotide-binding protein
MPPVSTIIKIISGGQTGVDRAALDAAIEAGLAHGGWCPRGRRAEDGALDPRYRLRETGSPKYAHRTGLNVRDSDGTLILSEGIPEGGTALTLQLAKRHGKPVLVVDPKAADALDTIRRWLTRHHIEVLNVAGPRESRRPGVYLRGRSMLERLFAGVK